MTNAGLRIGILETGRPPDTLRGFGSYPDMVADWLAPLGGRFSSYAVLENDLPDSPGDADLWVITGSRFGVYEGHPWIAKLERFVRRAQAAGSRMIGICFGHQLIAQALGGRVEKSDRGWGIGLHEYQPVNWPAPLAPAPETLRIQAFHQDQVIEPPNAARRIARSDFCENAALWYPGFAFTVQGHPEFGAAYASRLLAARRGSVLPPALVDRALEGIDAASTRRELALLLRDSVGSL